MAWTAGVRLYSESECRQLRSSATFVSHFVHAGSNKRWARDHKRWAGDHKRWAGDHKRWSRDHKRRAGNKRWARDHKRWAGDHKRWSRGHKRRVGDHHQHPYWTNSSLARRSHRGDLPDGLLLVFSGAVLTNLGDMARREARGITVRATGDYLVSMRLDPYHDEADLAVSLVADSRLILWTLHATVGVQVGDMTALLFPHGTTLSYALYHTSRCRVEDDALISVALYGLDVTDNL